MTDKQNDKGRTSVLEISRSNSGLDVDVDVNGASRCFCFLFPFLDSDEDWMRKEAAVLLSQTTMPQLEVKLFFRCAVLVAIC